MKNYKYSFIFALLFLFFNPFFYGRFVDGQSNVYLSLLFLPVLIGATYYIWTKPIGIKPFLFFLATTLIFGGISTHNIIFLPPFFLLFFLFFFEKNRSYFNRIIQIGIAVIFAIAPWVYLTFNNTTGTAELVSNFKQEHFLVFQPQNQYLSSFPLTLLTLHGYRGEAMTRFQPSYLGNSKHIVSWSLVWLLTIIGGIYIYKKTSLNSRRLYSILVVMSILSFILGGGLTRGGNIGDITQRLYDHLYFYRGLREPHKWMMWLVILYAISGSFGITYLFEIAKKHLLDKRVIYLFSTLLSLLPILITPALLFGAQGQIKVGNYPSNWYDLKTQLESYNKSRQKCPAILDGKKYCRSILVLPRHGYLSFPFTQGRVIANPIYSFMGNTGLMVSDTVEIGPLYSQTTKRENIIYQNNIYPHLSGLLYESDLDHTRSYDFVNDAIIRKAAHWFNYIGIKDVIVFKTSSERKTDVDRLSFLVLHGYATIQETNDDYVWYSLNLNERLQRN